MLKNMSNSTPNTQKVESNFRSSSRIYFKLFLAVSATITLFLVYVNLNNIKSLFQKTREKRTRKLNDIAIVAATLIVLLIVALTMMSSNSSRRAPGSSTPANDRLETAEALNSGTRPEEKEALANSGTRPKEKEALANSGTGSKEATATTTSAEDLLKTAAEDLLTTTTTTSTEDLSTATTEAKISEADIKALPVYDFYVPLLAFFVILMIAFVVYIVYVIANGFSFSRFPFVSSVYNWVEYNLHRVCGAITNWIKRHLAKEDKLVDGSEDELKKAAAAEKEKEEAKEAAEKEKEEAREAAEKEKEEAREADELEKKAVKAREEAKEAAKKLEIAKKGYGKGVQQMALFYDAEAKMRRAEAAENAYASRAAGKKAKAATRIESK